MRADGDESAGFRAAIMIIAVALTIGGVLGVMNTMFAAISQREKDIGVLRILGYARWQILESFFVESLMLALIGGAIGCLLGMTVDGWSASSIISSARAFLGLSVAGFTPITASPAPIPRSPLA